MGKEENALLQHKDNKLSNDFILFFHSKKKGCQKILCNKNFGLTHPNETFKWHVYLLSLSQTSPGFHVFAVQVFRKHWEKEKLLVMRDFSFSHTVFYPYGELSAIFIKFEIVICNLFQFGKV